MSPRLVYLHIPKTGGSSQRFTLCDLYQRENVFWFGIDDAQAPARSFEPGIFGNASVIGGHKPIGFYPTNMDALYFSIIREPVERVCSLFNHITRAGLGKHEKEHDRNYNRWLALGMDPDSVVNSLAGCGDFRRQASNYQCHFLSRHGPGFADACKTMQDISCVVCTQDNIAALNHYLGNLFQWIEIPEKRMNRGRHADPSRVLDEPGAREAIAELNREDIKLYDYILNSHAGLYTHIPDPERFSRALSSTQFPPAISAQEAKLRYLSVYSKGYAGMHSTGAGGTSVIIANTGETDIGHTTGSGLTLRYQVLDTRGDILASHASPEPLGAGIPAGGQLVRHLDIQLSPAHLPLAASLRIDVMVTPVKSVADLNPLHPATVALIPVADH